jgi:hypothetical protein
MASLFSLNTALRLELRLNSDDGPKKQGEIIYEAMDRDLFMLRVDQIAWTYYRDKINGKGGEAGAGVASLISKILSETGLREAIVNTVVQLYEANYKSCQSSPYITAPLISRTSNNEPIEAIHQVRLEWEQGINEELLAIAQETSRPFTIARAPDLLNRY